MSDSIENKQDLQDFAHTMKRDWDERARLDAKWFINTLRFQQTEEEFDQSGVVDLERHVLSDLGLLTQGRDPKTLSLLEIGCGLGRMTKHLAKIFGDVVGTDVSGEMIRQARQRLAGGSNVRLLETNGVEFTVLPDESFDLVVSVRVFQHVPSADVIASNIREAWRVLKPGGVFKFQMNALTTFGFEEIEKDTWIGASFPESEIRRFARENNAQLISILGADTLSCWVMMRKPPVHTSALEGFTQPLIEFYGRTSDPLLKTIPTGGSHASLTILASGIDRNRDDCNSISVEMGEQIVPPCYVGPTRSNLEGILKAEIGDPLNRLTQIEIPIPAVTPSCLLPVRVCVGKDIFSEPINVEFQVAQPTIPKICTITNAYDNSRDVYAKGERSKLRILVEGLNEAADSGNVRVQIGERIVKPSYVGFLPSNGLYEVDAQVPEGIVSGMTQLSLYFGNLQSPCAMIEIKC